MCFFTDGSWKLWIVVFIWFAPTWAWETGLLVMTIFSTLWTINGGKLDLCMPYAPKRTVVLSISGAGGNPNKFLVWTFWDVMNLVWSGGAWGAWQTYKSFTGSTSDSAEWTNWSTLPFQPMFIVLSLHLKLMTKSEEGDMTFKNPFPGFFFFKASLSEGSIAQLPARIMNLGWLCTRTWAT